jgi:hypothetical protein
VESTGNSFLAWRVGESAVDETEVDVKYEPFKEIVILQQNQFGSPDDLARFASIIAGGKTAGLYWAEGVVFLYFLLPSSTETAAKALIENGRIYWTLVGYALMPKYKSIIETKEKIMVPVIDLSSNPVIRKVASWLKQQEKQT